MTPAQTPRRALLLAAGVLALAGCAPSGGAPPVVAPVPPPSPTAVATTPPPPDRLLGSRPATLDALRSEQGLRPVSVLMPGSARPAPVQARTTDPVSGGLDLPTGAATVAWWAGGASPGTPGSVVLAAHISYDGQTGPFTRLAQLPPGAQVLVTSADGSAHRYAVTGSRRAPKDALDRADLFRTDGPPALVLVTCGGAYDRSTHSYADNVVVSASPV